MQTQWRGRQPAVRQRAAREGVAFGRDAAAHDVEHSGKTGTQSAVQFVVLRVGRMKGETDAMCLESFNKTAFEPV